MRQRRSKKIPTLIVLALFGVVGCFTTHPPNLNKGKGFLYGKKGKLLLPTRGRISSPFGVKRGSRYHKGVDIAAPRGTTIRAADSGRVTYSGWKKGYGMTIVVKHKRASTLYAHCARVLVRDGDWVDRGDIIAYVGSSGSSSGSHLHLEYRDRKGRALNPMKYMRL